MNSPPSTGAAGRPALAVPEPGQILLSRADLKALGIHFSKTQLLRLEWAKRFPRRLRLSGSSICWDRDEVLAWIEARKEERGRWLYAEPE